MTPPQHLYRATSDDVQGPTQATALHQVQVPQGGGGDGVGAAGGGDVATVATAEARRPQWMRWQGWWRRRRRKEMVGVGVTEAARDGGDGCKDGGGDRGGNGDGDGCSGVPEAAEIVMAARMAAGPVAAATPPSALRRYS